MSRERPSILLRVNAPCLAAFALSACVSPASVVIEAVQPIPVQQSGGSTGGCVCSPSTLQQESGEVDLNLSAFNPQFCWVGELLVNNTLSASAVASSTTNDPILVPTRNDFLISSMELTYRRVDGTIYSGTEAVPMSGTVSANSVNKSPLCVDLCSPNAAAKLSGESATPPLDLLVGIRLLGQTVAGVKMVTNEFNFPIQYVRRSSASLPTTCAAGTVPTEIDPPTQCEPLGQDGTGFFCAAAGAGG